MKYINAITWDRIIFQEFAYELERHPPESWELPSFSIFWKLGAYILNPYKDIFFLNLNTLPLSHPGDQSKPMRLIPWRFGTGTEDFNCLKF